MWDSETDRNMFSVITLFTFPVAMCSTAATAIPRPKPKVETSKATRQKWSWDQGHKMEYQVMSFVCPQFVFAVRNTKLKSLYSQENVWLFVIKIFNAQHNRMMVMFITASFTGWITNKVLILAYCVARIYDWKSWYLDSTVNANAT